MGTGTLEALVGYTVTQLCSHYPQDACVMDMVTATNFSILFQNDAPTDALAERSKAVAQGAIP